MNDFVAGWYLIYTKPRHEKKVSARLCNLNINHLMPVRKSLRKWHDRKKYVQEPLFPSYVFVYLEEIKNYYQGLDIDSALYYVKFGSKVARINETIIQNIQLVTGADEEIEITGNYFRPGQQVYIQDGPLTGLSCEIVEANGVSKFLVRLNLMQRNLLMAIPSEYLTAV